MTYTDSMRKKPTQLQVTVSPMMLDRLDAYITSRGLLRQEVIRQAIADFLDQKDSQKALMSKMGDTFATHIPELETMLKEIDAA